MAQVGDGGVITHCLWDSDTPAAGVADVTLFTEARGAGTRTKYDSNMVQAGTLPKRNFMTVMAVGWWWEPDMSLANAIALSKGYYEIWVSDKVMNEGLLMQLPGGSGLWAAFDNLAAATELVNPGQPDARNLLSLSRSFKISENESFEVRLRWGTAPNPGQRFWFGLFGELQRPLN